MSIFDNWMSPLGKNHCMFFYYLGLLSLLFAAFAAIGFVLGFFQKKSGYAMGAYVMSLISYVLMYYISRLYYSICIVSLR
jgi:hypothetical protein